MEILNATVHELIKVRNARGATVIPPEEGEITKSDSLDGLLTKVLHSYNSRCSRHSGSFEQDTENFRFSPNLQGLMDGQVEFLEFTNIAMERLRTIINDITFASGGFLMYVRYTHNDRDMLLVAKLNKESGSFFSANLREVVESNYLNVDHLQVAARVALQAWQNGEERYLTFVMKQDKDNPSDYFKGFIGCKIDQDSKIESRKLVKVVKDFVSHQIEANAIQPDFAPDLQQRAYDYVEALHRQDPTAPLSFDALANTVWPENPETFLTFINNHAEQPSTGFIPDRTALKALSNINFKSKELTLKTTYHFKQQHIRIEGNQVIIDNAPERLIAELREG